MKFELEPDNIGQPDEALLQDLRRVSEKLAPKGITKDLYSEHGKWCAATMQKRFGNWNAALEKAGIIPTFKTFVPNQELIQDLKNVAAALGQKTVTIEQNRQRGKFSEKPYYRNFGNWNGALRAAGLEPGREPIEVTDAVCFEVIEMIWTRNGRQPRRDEVRLPEVKISGQAITNHFGSWRKALESFVSYVNDTNKNVKEKDFAPIPTSTNVDADKEKNPPPASRNVGWRVRFLVMRRDNFCCRLCGKSPATHLGTKLVIDHIVAWSKGGPTEYDNLQTLCEPCNGGRNNLDLKL